MDFNPNDYLIKLKGKDYLPVLGRMVWYREKNTTGTKVRVLDKIVNLEKDNGTGKTKGFAYFELEITDSNGNIEIGVGSETATDFADFIEKAFTKAYGRALAALGYGTQFAAAEFDEGPRIVDSPYSKQPANNTATVAKTYSNPVVQPQAGESNKPSSTVTEVSDRVTKTQLQEIARLMKANKIDALSMANMTKTKFEKTRSVDLTIEEADSLIDIINKEALA